MCPTTGFILSDLLGVDPLQMLLPAGKLTPRRDYPFLVKQENVKRGCSPTTIPKFESINHPKDERQESFCGCGSDLESTIPPFALNNPNRLFEHPHLSSFFPFLGIGLSSSCDSFQIHLGTLGNLKRHYQIMGWLQLSNSFAVPSLIWFLLQLLVPSLCFKPRGREKLLEVG